MPAASTLRLLAFLAAVAMVTASVLSPANVANGLVVCPFRLITGLPCPGCGMTRAWVFALHGELRAALTANPFVLVTLPAAVMLVLVVSAAALRRRPPPDIRPVLSSVVARVLLAGWLAFAVVRAVAVLTGRATI